jgi:hypothetical protein
LALSSSVADSAWENITRHFMELVTLLNICLQFEITTDEVETLREGLIKWVEDYEK